MERTRVEPSYMLLSISSMLSMLNNSLENCLPFGGYALAREIVDSDACIKTVQLLHQVLSKIRIRPSETGEQTVEDLRDANGFRTMADFLEEMRDLLLSLKEGRLETDEAIIAALNRRSCWGFEAKKAIPHHVSQRKTVISCFILLKN